MRFSLTEKGRTRIHTTFHVADSTGTVVGSINVPHGQEDDLLKHWRGTAAVAETGAKGAAAAVAKSFRAQRRRGAAGTGAPNRPAGMAAAILRAAGC